MGISDSVTFSMRIPCKTIPWLECLHSHWNISGQSQTAGLDTFAGTSQRPPPRALARGQYSLTPLADEGEERFYSEDTLNSIHPLNSTLTFHAYMGSTRKRNFHAEHAAVLIYSCSLQFTTLTRILLPSSISFDPDLPLFTP